MADENQSPQERARAAMIARSNKGKKAVVKTAAQIAAEAETKIKAGKKGDKVAIQRGPKGSGKIIENF